MGFPVSILPLFLNKNRYQKTLQFETMTNMRSVFSNVWYASTRTLKTSILARHVKNNYVSSYPMYSLWFDRFMLGLYKRIRNMVRQDNAMTLNVIYRLVEDLEGEFMIL